MVRLASARGVTSFLASSQEWLEAKGAASSRCNGLQSSSCSSSRAGSAGREGEGLSRGFGESRSFLGAGARLGLPHLPSLAET